ncbi:hypothetical protein SAMN05661096_03600 [Marivirga sericea]|uniref:Uncharacterized protein n=1 Tax=Marivirga sericea TaxID=1028 RepID=A0A1X7L774_9BACT|nr:hypothetical protein [Marivirga sericea]SMG49314.1 hypothetical protein SAMN05661096_03600 [Marivirga sericea]
MVVANLGGAIEYWLGFQDKIGRSFMMNENALKYPLADYLVNEGNVDLQLIDLERAHPNFSNRQVDLTVLNPQNAPINNLFELKLAKVETRYQSEKQRIFNDLMRLYLGSLVSTDKCYFIITGKTTHFQTDFKNSPNTGIRFYDKWFSFIKGQTRTFNVATETNSTYWDIYNEFQQKYSKKYKGQTSNTLQLPNQITTTCEFMTAFSPSLVPYMIGVWSVK